MSALDSNAFSRFEQAGWQAKTRGYHATYATISGYVIERLLDAVEARQGKRLLDLGTGPGYVVAAARSRGCEAVGIDFAPAMVELALSLHPGCCYEIGDAMALGFPATTFDSVTGNFVFHHIPQQDVALGEARRVLKPGGRIGLTVWGSPDQNRLLGLFLDSMRASGADAPPDLPPGPPMSVSDDAYRDQLEAAGYEDVTVEHLSWMHRFPSATALWDGIMESSVRTAALIELQPSALREGIRRTFDTLVKAHQVDAGLDVPVAATLIGGRVSRQ
jgi:ubiquinone/menaquinone biosynthesis C-methylase UbiE